jgi:kinesin family member C2/C3
MADVAAAVLSLSAAAVVEDVLRQHGCRLSDRDLASRRAEEAGAVRASSWLVSFRLFGLVRAGGIF